MPAKNASTRISLTKADLLSELDSADLQIAGLEAEIARLRTEPPGVAAAGTDTQPNDHANTPSDGYFRRLIEGSLQAIRVRQDNVTVFANQAFAEMFGYGSPR